MALAKLKICAEKSQVGVFSEKIDVLFNPNQISIVKSGWTKSQEAGMIAINEPDLTIEI